MRAQSPGCHRCRRPKRRRDRSGPSQGIFFMEGARLTCAQRRSPMLHIFSLRRPRATMTFERDAVSHCFPRFRRIAVAAIAYVGVFLMVEVLVAAAQWNEIPAPTGKEALSRTYPAGYRTDVVDVPIRGNNGELE